MERIDWYKHYRQKIGLDLATGTVPYDPEVEKPFVDFVKRHLPIGSRILECGIGLGRAAVALQSEGFSVSGIEQDPRLLAAAWCLSTQRRASLDLHLGDLFEVLENFPANSFDAVTHEGVLEHCEVPEIVKLLTLELGVAPKVLFSVPIAASLNEVYFNDSNHRNLWTSEYWMSEVLRDFPVIDSQAAEQRSRNLFVAIQSGALDPLSAAEQHHRPR